jgi:hypothetical protein
LYQKIAVILKALKKNARAIKNLIKDWEDRDKVESFVKPRWSESDESKYGTTLNYELHRTRRIIEMLRGQEEMIESKISEIDHLSETVRRLTSDALSVLDAPLSC